LDSFSKIGEISDEFFGRNCGFMGDYDSVFMKLMIYFSHFVTENYHSF